MFNKLASAAGDLAGKAGDAASKAGSLGAELIQSTAAEFNAAKPLFARVGYRVGLVQLELGMTPKLVIQLRHVADVDAETFDQLVAEHKGNKVLTAVVSALRQASALQGKVKFQGMSFTDVEVEVGIPPAVRLSFREDEAPSIVSSALAAIEEAVAPASPAPAPSAPAPADSSDERSEKEKEIEEMIASGEKMRFSCPGCEKALVVRTKYAGRDGECRHCGMALVIPARPPS